MVTPAQSLEAIISAMMCLCSTSQFGGNDLLSKIPGQMGAASTNQSLVILQPATLVKMNEKLEALDSAFAEIENQQRKILQSLDCRTQIAEVRAGTDILGRCPTQLEGKETEIVNIKTPSYENVFPVLCNGRVRAGGWMVVLKRHDGSVDFFRTWNDYKAGFGSLEGEYFIGLEKLHALTKDGSSEMLMLFEDFENDRRYAQYEKFEISNEAEGYALKVLDGYQGTAGNSLRHHISFKFSTYDRDNDNNDSKEGCAVQYTGAWWYNNCHNANLFGQYFRGTLSKEKFGKGMVWQLFRGLNYSLKSVQMMVRPKIVTTTLV